MRTVLALSVLFAPLAFAQDPNAVRAAGADFQAATAPAAAAAARPGDEALGCEQLQTEFVALAQTPAYRNFALQQGATAVGANDAVAAGLAAAGLATAAASAPVPDAAAAP